MFARIGDTDLERNCVLSGGDDYELVFTAPQSRRAEVEALGVELGLALACVGYIRRATRNSRCSMPPAT